MAGFFFFDNISARLVFVCEINLAGSGFSAECAHTAASWLANAQHPCSKLATSDVCILSVVSGNGSEIAGRSL